MYVYFFLIVLVIPFYLYHYTIVYPEKGSLMQGDFHLFSEE